MKTSSCKAKSVTAKYFLVPIKLHIAVVKSSKLSNLSIHSKNYLIIDRTIYTNRKEAFHRLIEYNKYGE